MSDPRNLSGAFAKRLQFARFRVDQTPLVQERGNVVQLIGLVIESEGPLAGVGDLCRIMTPGQGGFTLGEVVGFRNNRILLMPLGNVHGLRPGSEVIATGKPFRVQVGERLKGRVIDGLGNPIDGLEALKETTTVPLNAAPPHPLKRRRITEPFATGVKAIDTFMPCGRGQRIGVFAGSGVGKSTLMGMIASQAEADVNVIALIGERGREVREFIERDLGEKGRRRSVVVVATSDDPPLLRLKAAFLAVSIAEYFRDQGGNVLMMMDSVTRFAMAQREIGLAVGEPPASRGYTPSVFSLLPQLLERIGNSDTGMLTGLLTVLVEADDMNDPIADSVRSIIDGHIILSRELAALNHYPAIDVLDSVSRLAGELTSDAQKATAAQAREYLAVYRKNEDLIQIGAYSKGSHPLIDRAVALHEPLNAFLRQGVRERVSRAESWAQLGKAVATGEGPSKKA